MDFRLVDHQSAISTICRRHGVRRLELVGSAARGDFDPRHSDLDFLVEFDDRAGGAGLDTYFGLKDDLESLFERPVDLVMPAAVRNPYLKAEFARDRKLVYAA